jgi:hypothetical protein
MTQTIKVAQVTAASGTMVDIEIDKIVLGGVTIGQLVLQGTSLDVASGSAFLQNVRIVITLDFTFNWWINLGFWSDSGSANLGSLSFGMALGNVSIPSLNNIPLSIPNIVIANVSAIIAPLTSVDLGGGSFSGLTATNIAIPKSGFTLTGLALGSVSVSTVQLPETAVAKLSVQDFHPNTNIVLPSVTLGPVQLPSGSAADIQTTTPIAFNGIASQQGLGFSLGVLGGSILVTPTAYVSIGSLLLQGVSLSGTVTKAILDNIGVPVDIRGINLSSIDIGQIDANNITV